MKVGVIGLRGKLVIALVITAAVPLVIGIVVLHTAGFRYLLAERGRAHAAEAHHLAGSLEQEVEGQATSLKSWLTADASLLAFTVRENLALAVRVPTEIEAETKEIDAAWAEWNVTEPQVHAVLTNSGAASLQAFLALHPLVAEVLATDSLGRVIASAHKSSDYNQADESWWVKGQALASGGTWTDSLHLDQSAGVYSIDLVMSLHESGQFSGVIKMVIDATPLFERIATEREHLHERVEVVLPDGRILARLSVDDYESLSSRIDPEIMISMQDGGDAWTIISDHGEGEWMTGFAVIHLPGRRQAELPAGFVLISTNRDTVVGPVRQQLLWVAIAAGLGVGLFALAGYQVVSRKILWPLEDLKRAARAVTDTAQLRHGDDRSQEEMQESRLAAERGLHSIKAIHTGDEIEELAGDLSVMTSRVLDYHREMESEVAAKTAVIREDLEMAREFQNALMPTVYPEVPPSGTTSPLRLHFSHVYQPSAMVGGDFFDFIEFDDCRAGVLIADVMGHGARSALVTAIMRGLVRDRSGSRIEPGEFLIEVNQQLHDVISRSGQDLFVTAFLMILDTRESIVEWAVAGHPAPLRVRRGSDSPPQPLWANRQGQPALGLLPDAHYQTHQETLQSGDVFLLYTDGIMEAENPEGKEFGVSGLTGSFASALSGLPAELLGTIIGDLTVHLDGQACEDDVCLVVVETEQSD